MQDSLHKYSSIKGQRSVVCKYYDDKKYYFFSLLSLNYPITIQNEYEIITYNDFNVIILGKQNITKLRNDTKTRELVKNKIITLKKSNKTENYTFTTFCICRNNIEKINVYDNVMVNDSVIKNLKIRKPFKDSIFYPNCD